MRELKVGDWIQWCKVDHVKDGFKVMYFEKSIGKVVGIVPDLIRLKDIIIAIQRPDEEFAHHYQRFKIQYEILSNEAAMQLLLEQ